jgi:hypothetical protein
MSPVPKSTTGVQPREVRLDRLIGVQVLTRSNRSAGRLEEFRTEMRGKDCVVSEFVLGGAGLLERLGLGMKLLFGRAVGGYVARWDQLDFSDPERPRLTCAVDELRVL